MTVTTTAVPGASTMRGTTRKGPPVSRKRVSPTPSGFSSTTAVNSFRTAPSRALGTSPGAGEDVERRALVDDPSVIDQKESRANRDRLGRAVRDIEHRDLFGNPDCAKPLDQGVAARQVECGDRLVAEQEPGSGGQGPGEADALPLAARKCRRAPVQKVTDATERGDLGHPMVRLGVSLTLQAEPEVAGDAQVGEQQVVLKDHGDPSRAERAIETRRRVEKRLAQEPDESAVGTLETGDQPQERRLAGSRSAEDDPAFAVERERDVEPEPRMDLSLQVNFERVAQRPSPRAGSERCTVQSAAIEISETQPESQAARAGSLASTAL